MENIKNQVISGLTTVSLSIPQNGTFNPVESLVMKAGRWLFTPIVDPVNNLLSAYSSTRLKKFGTTYYLHYAGLDPSQPRFYVQVPSSSQYQTQADAVKYSIPYLLNLDYMSIVTIFIYSNYNDPRVIGGGITLQIEPVKK